MSRFPRASILVRQFALPAIIIVAVAALAIATAVNVVESHSASGSLQSAHAEREAVRDLRMRAEDISSDALSAYAEGRNFPNRSVVAFFALTREIENLFTAESMSGNAEIRRTALLNLSNLEDAKEAVATILAAEPGPEGEATVLASVDVSSRFFRGLEARQEVSQERIEAVAGQKARSETRALSWGLGLLAALCALFGVTAARAGISRRRRLDRMTTLAATDQLTGLLNRRGIDENLREAARRCPFTVVLLDLDDFKAVNDHYGHQAGDLVLEETARRIDGCLEDREFAGRFGGDEFLVCIPSVGEAAEERIAAVLGALSRNDFPVVGPVAASAGYATCREPGDVLEVVHRADSAMYQAKEEADSTNQVAPLRPANSVAVQNRLALERTAARIDELDPGSVGHSQRVARMAKRLALAMEWSEGDAERLAQAAKVHDVGKVVLPEELLIKPRALSDAEYELVKQHPGVGARMAATALDPEQCGWIRHHHEWWAGRGYPDGLVEGEIPEGARLLAIADAWDAMTSERVYADATSPAEALAECQRSSGTQLWPAAVEVLGEKVVQTGADAPVTF